MNRHWHITTVDDQGYEIHSIPVFTDTDAVWLFVHVCDTVSPVRMNSDAISLFQRFVNEAGEESILVFPGALYVSLEVCSGGCKQAIFN